VISKIIVTRPAVSVDEEHGFLPGDLNAKMAPWTRPIMDVFEEYYHPKEIAEMLEDGVIEISPLAYMRGRTFKNAFIVADEMQNTTPSQMKMLLTRIGNGSRMVVTGDLNQADRPDANGLLEFCNLYGRGGEYRMIAMARFESQDIERHPVVKEILSIYCYAFSSHDIFTCYSSDVQLYIPGAKKYTTASHSSTAKYSPSTRIIPVIHITGASSSSYRPFSFISKYTTRWIQPSTESTTKWTPFSTTKSTSSMYQTTKSAINDLSNPFSNGPLTAVIS
jgi:hypothetical protein